MAASSGTARALVRDSAQIDKKKAPLPDRRGVYGSVDSYDPAFCEMMVNYCSEGYSITGFAGKIGRSRETLAEWGKRHPEFQRAIYAAKAAACVWWEAKHRQAIESGASPSILGSINMQLRNLAQQDIQDRITVDKNTRSVTTHIHAPTTAREALEAYRATLRGEDVEQGQIIEGEIVEEE